MCVFVVNAGHFFLQSLERKNGWYKVELQKKTDFNVANFFLPDSPPV